MVPLAHDLEIRGSLAERRAGVPAVFLKKVGRRGEHIWHAVPEIDMPVTIIVDAVFNIGGRQKLRLADLSRIGADQVARGKIAALNDLQGREQLTLKEFAAPAIVSQGGKRSDHGQLAHVAGAVVGLKCPDGHDEPRWHAEVALDAPEEDGVPLHQLSGALDASWDDAGRRVLLEALTERAALAPVEGKHRAVRSESGERAVDHCPRNPGSGGFTRHGGQEGVEIASAPRRAGGQRENQGAQDRAQS